MRYEKYERCQIVMACINAQPKSKKQTIHTIYEDTGIPSSSVSKTIYRDYRNVFTSSPLHGGYILTGEWPEDEWIDLDKVWKQFNELRRIGGTRLGSTNRRTSSEKPFAAKYFDQGYDAIIATLTPSARNVLRLAIESEEKIDLKGDLAQLYNTVRAIETIIRVCRSDNRQEAFNRLVEGDSINSKRTIDRRA